MNLWKSDFSDIQRRFPCWFTRLIRPRLVFLPAWWPVRYGAWAYCQFIFIAPGLHDAPDNVRRYLLGHEYGHIYCKHTVLHFVYWLGMAGLCSAFAVPSPLLHVGSLSVLMVVTLLACLPRLAKAREFQADAVAVQVFGQQVVLSGSLWMAEKAGTTANVFRQSRLRRLGWQGEAIAVVRTDVASDPGVA
ncbi:MAG: M48 family metalloprotease [Pseudomonadota bacterium]